MRAELLRNLGGAYGEMNRPKEAMQILREALAISEQLGDTMGIATAQSSMGLAAMAAGDWPQAEQYFSQALDGVRRLQHPVGMIYCLGYLGQVKQKQGHIAEAAAYYRQAD